MSKFYVLVALALAAMITAGCAKLREEANNLNSSPSIKQCSICHGSAKNAAPPNDTEGRSATTEITVGAHQAHVNATISRPLACTECHKVPKKVDDEGHIGGGDAKVKLGELSKTGGAKAKWDRKDATCATYCHGATLTGGSAPKPVWTKVDGTQKQCGSCHGFPPAAPHPNSAECALCHATTVDSQGRIAYPENHINGKTDFTAGGACNSCHGSANNPAPPVDTSGRSDTTLVSVGAHQTHLNSTLTTAVKCSECHVVPDPANSMAHIDGGPAQLAFSGRAVMQGARATWKSDATCTNYCHGSTMGGGTANQPIWTRVNGSQNSCDSCHGYPPALDHPQSMLCSKCHGDTVDSDDMSIKDVSKHINGTVEVGSMSCNACHGNAENAAPPIDTKGNSDRGQISVGAHQAHLKAMISKPIQCSECHKIPTQIDSPGHLNGKTEVGMGPISTSDGVIPVWNRPAANCTTYCHGVTLGGGTLKTPVWTEKTGTAGTCGTCHGNPPPAPHIQSALCSGCHADTVGPDGKILKPENHVDGKVQVTASCTACHGSVANAAPPVDTRGQSATTLVSVGAHQIHLATTLGKPVACGECHSVPADASAPGHISGAAEVRFGPLWSKDGATPVWNRPVATCTTYCHGATLAGGTAKTPVWTKVDGSQKNCGSCHGFPPANPHPQMSDCAGCHEETVGPDGRIKDINKHVDGVVQVAGGSCNACHGSATSIAPPVDTQGRSATTFASVGAHQSHLQPNPKRGKSVACSECHPMPGVGVHENGKTDLVFGPLARKNGAAATWDPVTATCTNYCHGVTLAGGTRKNPYWTKVDRSQVTCGICHGLSPASGKHPRNFADHSFMGTACQNCHFGETQGLTLLKPELHIDGIYQVAFDGGGSWNAATKTCTNACHSEPVKW